MSKSTKFGKVGTRPGGSYSKDETYVSLNSHKHDENVSLKQKALAYGLPVLDRKWSRIDESISADRYTKASKIRDLIDAGFRTGEIAAMLDISSQSVSNMRKRRIDNAKRLV